MGFTTQEYWSGLPCPPSGVLPDPGTEPTSLASPTLAGGFFTTEPPGKPYQMVYLASLGETQLELFLLQKEPSGCL